MSVFPPSTSTELQLSSIYIIKISIEQVTSLLTTFFLWSATCIINIIKCANKDEIKYRVALLLIKGSKIGLECWAPDVVICTQKISCVGVCLQCVPKNIK